MSTIIRNDELYHWGVKGMKWGVRRYQNEDGTLTEAGKKRYETSNTIRSTKTGEYLHIGKRKKRNNLNESFYDIIGNGKKVGNLILETQGNNLYINWIDIKKNQRGKGYADSIIDYVVKTSEQEGYKSLTLEVPGNSPDARHIYEKHGFREYNNSNKKEDDVWGGLTYMKRELRG